jgi:hypothetical protein
MSPLVAHSAFAFEPAGWICRSILSGSWALEAGLAAGTDVVFIEFSAKELECPR